MTNPFLIAREGVRGFADSLRTSRLEKEEAERREREEERQRMLDERAAELHAIQVAGGQYNLNRARDLDAIGDYDAGVRDQPATVRSASPFDPAPTPGSEFSRQSFERNTPRADPEGVALPSGRVYNRRLSVEAQNNQAAAEDAHRKELAEIAALEEYLGDPAAARAFQVSGGKLGVPEKPTAPLMGSPEWREAQKFLTDENIRQHNATRPPEGAGGGAMSSTQARVLGMFREFEDGLTKYENLFAPREQGGQGMAPPGITEEWRSKVPLLGNVLAPESYQVQRAQAQRFADPWLRFTSGAAVPAPEVERFFNAYIVKPGDKPATIAAKQQARQNLLGAFRTAATGGVEEGSLEARVLMEDALAELEQIDPRAAAEAREVYERARAGFYDVPQSRSGGGGGGLDPNRRW